MDKSLTQEEVAARMNVTGQAVGKWERDECYPDITLLPGLANLFGVTIDELVGIETVNMQDKTNEVQKRKYELARQGKYAELVAFLEEESKYHPNEWLQELGIALVLAGDKTERPLYLAEQALEESGTRSHKGYNTLCAELCFLYQRYGFTEKAEKMARSLPHTHESRELLLPHFLEAAKRAAYLRENLPGILTTICSLIDGDIMTNDEHLQSIHYGTYTNLINPSDAAEKIVKFLAH